MTTAAPKKRRVKPAAMYTVCQCPAKVGVDMFCRCLEPVGRGRSCAMCSTGRHLDDKGQRVEPWVIGL